MVLCSVCEPVMSYPPQHLQVGHALLQGLAELSKQALLLQELGISSVSSWLEEAVIINVPQRLAERTNNLLLRAPNAGIGIKPQTLLQTEREKQVHKNNRLN